MEARKKQLLERYSALRNEVAMNYLYPSKQEQLKLELAKVKFEMEMNDLTEADFNSFKSVKYQEDQTKRATANRIFTNRALRSGILFLVAGVAAILLAIGLTEGTNGSLVFYGIAFLGIFLIVKGGLELYAYKAMK